MTRIAASGNSSASSAMNGIDPPTPTSTGSTPKPSASAARPSCSPQLSDARKPCPQSTSLNSSSAPNGTCWSRWARSASYAWRASWPGATRALITTETSGFSVLDAASVPGKSMPVTVMDGWFQSRSSRGPAPIGRVPAGRSVSSRSRASA